MKVTVPDLYKDDEKETERVELENPPADLIESQKELQEVEARFKRRALTLNDEDRHKLEAELERILDDWIDARSTLKAKLRERNDLFEGVTTVTDYPWPGASSVDIPLAKIKTREITSTINRTTMRPVPFLMTRFAGPDSLFDQTSNYVKDLENFVEDKLKNDTNVHETLKDAIPVVIRDGTCPVQIIWETEYETVRDFKVYTAPEDFAADYASPDAAGLESATYRQIIKMLSSGTPYEVEYEYEVATYDGPKAYLVNLIDFVHWPVFIPRLKDCKVHGKRVWFTDYQLEHKAECGQFDKDLVENLVKTSGDEHDDDTITLDRDLIDGYNRGTDKTKAKEYEFFELVWKGALTSADRKSNTIRKYLVYFHYQSAKIYRIESYPIRKGKESYFTLRLIRRDNRLLGVSLMDDISDLCLEINTIHRQRINSRTITHVPSFKAKDSVKHLFDPSRRDLRFKPGVTFYVGQMDDIEQFDIRPVDLSGSVDDEMLLFQLVDMVTGSTSGLSGQANPIDPRAPARKQSELLRQSTNRIDDYVQALIPEFEMVGQFVIDLYYQFGPDRIKYYVKQQDGAVFEREMDRSKLFNPNVTFKVQGVSVFTSPEQEYERAVETHQLVGNDPLTAQMPRIRRKSLERVLKAGRVQDEQALLPNDQEMQALLGQPNPANPNQPTNASQSGLIPTAQDKEAEVDAAMANQKAATKIGDAVARRNHEVDMRLLDAAVTEPQSPGGEGAAQTS